MHLTVDSGQDPVVHHLPDGVWSGPPRYRVSFRGTLIEWSLDAIGWLGEFIADLAAREGAGVPLLLTVSRPAPAGAAI
ncbi:hypothetical protein OG943_13760 [Amycolatopsis sp. NBC_00345]|uniref:hypothetical protein n=1 Tax=Amycolatopsis sp. NBC_00345 TaxID=2975955 RepID=UPI002E26D57C